MRIKAPIDMNVRNFHEIAKIKKFRLQNKGRMKHVSAPEFQHYRQMIDEVTKELHKLIAPHVSIDRSPGFKGGGNIYTEFIRHDEVDYFLKVTEARFDNEMTFYTALMSGIVEHESSSYLIPAPASITQVGGLRFYLFPCYRFQPLTINDFNGSRRHDLMACIASFNSAHISSPELRRALRAKRYICRIEPKDIEAAFPQRPANLCRVLHQRIAAIFKGTQTLSLSMRAKRRQADQALCCNDFNIHNVGLLKPLSQERYVILDMGQSCLAPLGADLRWFFHYSIRNSSEVAELRRVANDYHRLITGNGVDASPDAIFLAGLEAYADKRLNNKLLAATSDAEEARNWRLLNESVDILERCLADLGAPWF